MLLPCQRQGGERTKHMLTKRYRDGLVPRVLDVITFFCFEYFSAAHDFVINTIIDLFSGRGSAALNFCLLGSSINQDLGTCSACPRVCDVEVEI